LVGLVVQELQVLMLQVAEPNLGKAALVVEVEVLVVGSLRCIVTTLLEHAVVELCLKEV
jgi:hypothetical protein